MIDVHAHFVPEPYRAAAEAAGLTEVDGFGRLPDWTATGHLDLMDRVGIETSVLSISSPGVHFGDDAAAGDLAREVNDIARSVARQHPGRFGVFGSLPLPDLDAALVEVERCYDRLDVDGVTLLTHSGGRYLGDPELEPLFDELDRRRARVFIHPTSPCGWEHTSLGRPRPMVEFLFDTTRAVVNLVLSGTIARHPNIEFIVPHGGAALPLVADRVAAFSFILGHDIDPRANVLTDLAGLHYDLAGFPLPRQLDALLALTTLDHLHYGSDFPFTPDFAVEGNRTALATVGDPAGSLLDALTVNTTVLLRRTTD